MYSIQRIEVCNFKSFKGYHTIGPFLDFTCIIGPNGSGKSNVLDAISFVLTLNASELRGSHIKDLINHNATSADESYVKMVLTSKNDDEMPIQASSKVEEESESEEGRHPTPPQEMIFSRYINTHSYSSTYKFNGKGVNKVKYIEELKRCGIDLSLRASFLIFQGDIRKVATMNSSERRDMIEVLCGSADYKEHHLSLVESYTKMGQEMLDLRAKVNGIRKRKEAATLRDKENAEYDELHKVVDALHSKSMLLQLYAIHEEVERLQVQSKELKGQKKLFEDRHDALEDEISKISRKKKKTSSIVTSLTAQLQTTHEKILDIDEAMDMLTSHKLKQDRLLKSVKRISKTIKTLEGDISTEKESISLCKKNKEAAVAKSSGISSLSHLRLSKPDISALNALIRRFKSREEQSVASLERWKGRLKVSEMNLERATELVTSISKTVVTLSTRHLDEEKKLKELTKRHKDISVKISEKRQEHEDNQMRLTHAEDEKKDIQAEITEIKRIIHEQQRIHQESQLIMRLRRELLNIQDHRGRVYGLVCDLVPSIQNSDKHAVRAALGRYTQAVVVENDDIAEHVLSIVKKKRLGRVTILPLSSLKLSHTQQNPQLSRAISDSVPSARLAIHCVSCDSSLQATDKDTLLKYVLGDTAICTTIRDACKCGFDCGRRRRCVTIEGHVVEKSGMVKRGRRQPKSAQGGII
ncbi:hypothetical protein ADUPG1_009244 [Aduncisulcus paluster]|uniref:SMC hinge domain-containing protein n=1 Tax=Aduncisulcus paluster TaxID=2918883 RepID=A0ABQ5KW53_9EUKA|nr:hypothetical protein ADUPG1_009244 [Aduncisulcus paluster]